MPKFKKLVVLDRILLLPQHWDELRLLCEELVEYSEINPQSILQSLHREMDEDPKPMCWTQLAQDEISKSELMKRIDGADALITCWNEISDELLISNNSLKYIGFWTNLAKHRINLEFAKDRGIFVTIIPDYGTDSVAELTFAGLLAVSRKLIKTHNNTLRGKWPYELLKTGQYVPKVNEIPQRLLRDKRIGIVGLGRIGKRVADLALAFNMKVSYWSNRKHSDYEAKGVTFSELDELFSTSDIVSIHLSPYAKPKIISKVLIKKLKNGSIFINTSAGALIDQEALFEEILQKRFYAFLDVYEGLPPRKILKKLSELDNVFTYRSGWYTQEAITYKGEYLINNIKKYLSNIPQKAAWDFQNLFPESLSEIQCSNEKR